MNWPDSACAGGIACAAALLLAGCSAVASHETRFTGLVTGCGPATHATLSATSDRFSFAPADGAIIIAGDRAADGSFVGTINLKGARPDSSGTQAWPLKVEGRIAGTSAAGSYSTPRCTARFDLRAVD